jgi:hypothetical protein
MGYSIAAPIKDKDTYARMWGFLSKNYVHPEELIYVSDPKSISDYDNGEMIVVFDYKSSEEDEDWAWAVTKWIAKVAGKTEKFQRIAQPIQYLRYDGDFKHIPISEVHNEMKLPEHLNEKLAELSRKWEEQNDWKKTP